MYKYNTWQLFEVKLISINKQSINILWSDIDKIIIIPISCLQYGVESFWKIGEIIELIVCEWILIERELI